MELGYEVETGRGVVAYDDGERLTCSVCMDNGLTGWDPDALQGLRRLHAADGGGDVAPWASVHFPRPLTFANMGGVFPCEECTADIVEGGTA